MSSDHEKLMIKQQTTMQTKHPKKGFRTATSEEGVTGRSVRGGHLPKITDSYRGVPRDRPRQAVTTSETAVVTVNKRHNGIKNRIPL